MFVDFLSHSFAAIYETSIYLSTFPYGFYIIEAHFVRFYGDSHFFSAEYRVLKLGEVVQSVEEKYEKYIG